MHRISYTTVIAAVGAALFVVFATFLSVLSLQYPPTVIEVEHKHKLAFPTVLICPDESSYDFSEPVCLFSSKKKDAGCPAVQAFELANNSRCYVFNMGSEPAVARSVQDEMTIVLPLNSSLAAEKEATYPMGKLAILYNGKRGVHLTATHDVEELMYPHVVIDSDSIYSVNLQVHEDTRGKKSVKHSMVPARYHKKDAPSSPQFKLVMRFETMTEIETEQMLPLAILHMIASLGGAGAIAVGVWALAYVLMRKGEEQPLCIPNETTRLYPLAHVQGYSGY